MPVVGEAAVSAAEAVVAAAAVAVASWQGFDVVGVDASSLLASSALEACSVGAADGSDLNCSNKVVVTLSIGSGQNNATEFLEAQLLSVVDDVTGETKVFAEPYRISVTKTPVAVTYPLHYVQTFNSHPFEEVVYTRTCSDGGNAEQPTCGWFRNEEGKRVENSQGFCCECSWGETIDETWGESEEVTRGNIDCNYFGNGGENVIDGTQESAHCLRFDPLWYNGFGIGESQLEFTITVTVAKVGASEAPSSSSPSTTPGLPDVQTLMLRPSVPLSKNAGGTVLARLEGDFAPYEAIPVYSEKLLMVPKSPEGVKDQTQWMMVDKGRMTFDGSECNKIGTSFEAFKVRQGDACRQKVDSCLENQLADLVEADAAMAASGRLGEYMLPNFGDLFPARVQNAETGEVTNALAFKAKPNLNSVVVLELSADAIRLVVHRATGAIVSVTVHDFESSSRDGKLGVVVRNTGELAAEFTVIISECTDLVALVNALSRTIVPGADEEFNFVLRAETTHTATHTCTVTLMDSLHETLHSVSASFKTNETQEEFGGQDGEVDREVRGIQADTSSSGAGGGDACVTICAGTWDIVCLIVIGCWTQITELIVYVLIILSFVGFTWWLITSGVLSRVFARSSSSESKCESTDSYSDDERGRRARRERGRRRRRSRSIPGRSRGRREREYVEKDEYDSTDSDWSREPSPERRRAVGAIAQGAHAVHSHRGGDARRMAVCDVPQSETRNSPPRYAAR